MASATDYLESAIGDHIFRNASWAKPAALYVGLFLTMPSEDGTGGDEVSAASYARVQYGPDDNEWSPPQDGDGTYANAYTVTFPEPTEDWGTIVGFGIWDDVGNLLIADTLANTKTVNNGDPAPEFNPGSLTVIVS